jgi:hypothetical protein
MGKTSFTGYVRYGKLNLRIAEDGEITQPKQPIAALSEIE